MDATQDSRPATQNAPVRGGASNVRALALVQIALGLANDRSVPERPYRELHLSLGTVKNGEFQGKLSIATGTPDLVLAVGRGDIDLAAMNPSAFLTMAYRGTGPFPKPLPVRAIAVMPSWDRMGFAIAERTGIKSFADIRERRYPLRISLRENDQHATRFVVDQVLGAAGFSLKDIEAWGGAFEYVDTPSHPDRLEGIRTGRLDALFDEGIKGWGPIALQHGMQLVGLDSAAQQRMQELGWGLWPIPQSRLPALQNEVMAVSFSGWPIYTHASLPDEVAYRMCAALDAARPTIPWDSEGPVELCDLCTSTDAAPLDVPLHPGAERYYREHGCVL